MHKFVENEEANKQINNVYNLVKKGKSDSKIASAFNDTGIKNLQTPEKAWDTNMIKTIRDTFKLDNDSPEVITSKIDGIQAVESNNKKPSIILIILSTILILIVALLNYIKAIGLDLDTGKFIGRISAAFILPLIMAAIFQIGQGFRNPSSRVKVVFWTSLIMFIGAAKNFISSIVV